MIKVRLRSGDSVPMMCSTCQYFFGSKIVPDPGARIRSVRLLIRCCCREPSDFYWYSERVEPFCGSFEERREKYLIELTEETDVSLWGDRT